MTCSIERMAGGGVTILRSFFVLLSSCRFPRSCARFATSARAFDRRRFERQSASGATTACRFTPVSTPAKRPVTRLPTRCPSTEKRQNRPKHSSSSGSGSRSTTRYFARIRLLAPHCLGLLKRFRKRMTVNKKKKGNVCVVIDHDVYSSYVCM